MAPAIAEALEATYWESLDQMLARMDIISVNCPHTPATYHLLSARRLKMLQPQAIVVNTARGEIIDENALARMLEAGEIAGAGLDVFEHEPAVSPKLVKLAKAGKVTLLPHMSSATHEGRIDMGEKVIINIRAFADSYQFEKSPGELHNPVFCSPGMPIARTDRETKLFIKKSSRIKIMHSQNQMVDAAGLRHFIPDGFVPLLRQ